MIENNTCIYDYNENEDYNNYISGYIANVEYDLCGYTHQALDSKGVCHNCKKEFDGKCSICKFFLNQNGTEELKCLLCENGYYFNEDGECINYVKNIDFVYDKNCLTSVIQIGKINILVSENKTFYDHYVLNLLSLKQWNNIYSPKELINIINNSLKALKNMTFPIKPQCIACKTGFHASENGTCVDFIQSRCKLIDLIKDTSLYSECFRMCKGKGLPFLYIEENLLRVITENASYFYGDEDLNFLYETFCLNGEVPEILKNCDYYIISNKKYVCQTCTEGYELNRISNTCEIYNRDDYICISENKGTKTNPIYSCKSCYSSSYTLVTQGDINTCVDQKYELEYCLHAQADTFYVETKYDCVSCEDYYYYYFSYYSKFYEKKICQNRDKATIIKKDLPEEFLYALPTNSTTNGKCEEGYFTPDGKNCYSCNDEFVGNPGCKGSCSFSLKRNNSLKCESGCEPGYIEVSEGRCGTCGSVNLGCEECHYETTYPLNYKGVKRKRRFVCDKCQDEYFFSDENTCLHCHHLGLPGCNLCEKNPKKEQYFCKACAKGYILNNGKCEYCDGEYEIITDNNTCVSCDDVVPGCASCEKNFDQVDCRLCAGNLILFVPNNTCLNRHHEDIIKISMNCEELNLDIFDNYICTRCLQGYILLKQNNTVKCILIPSLYPLDFFYTYDNMLPNSFSTYFSLDTSDPEHNDLIYGINIILSKRATTCQEAENIGSEINPFYNCIKYYNIFESSKLKYNYNTLITEQRNGYEIKYCNLDSFVNLGNCSEAILDIKGVIRNYTCTKCKDDNILTYDNKRNTYICLPNNFTSHCNVKNCKSCALGDNFFCEECISDEYYISIHTGSCLLKPNKNYYPRLCIKDLFMYQMHGVRKVNGYNIIGPTLRIRGLTSSLINKQSEFIINLYYKGKKYKKLRLLDDEDLIKIKSVCRAMNDVEESENSINVVDYDCIGYNTNKYNLSKYDLNSIEEGDNTDLLEKSNLKSFLKNLNLNELEKKQTSDFTEDKFNSLITFQMDELKNQTTSNNEFDFKIEGNINKEINPTNINGKLKMNEADDLQSDCNLEILENKKANLNCKLDVDKYNQLKIFTFDNTEIINQEYEIFLLNLNQIYLINNNEGTKEEPLTTNINVDTKIVDNTNDIIKDTITKDTIQETIAKDTIKDITTEDTIKGISNDITKDTIKETTIIRDTIQETIAKDTIKDITSEDTIKGISNDITKDTIKETTIIRDTIQETIIIDTIKDITSEDTIKGTSNDITKDTIKETTIIGDTIKETIIKDTIKDITTDNTIKDTIRYSTEEIAENTIADTIYDTNFISPEKNGNKSDTSQNYKSKKSSSNKAAVIAVCIVGGVVVLGVFAFVSYKLVKRKNQIQKGDNSTNAVIDQSEVNQTTIIN